MQIHQSTPVCAHKHTNSQPNKEHTHTQKLFHDHTYTMQEMRFRFHPKSSRSHIKTIQNLAQSITLYVFPSDG